MSDRAKNAVRIHWPHSGHQFADRYWCAILPNGDALDYGSLEHCKRVCEKHGYDWMVYRLRRKERRQYVAETSWDSTGERSNEDE